MSDAIGTMADSTVPPDGQAHRAHPGAAVYVIVAVFLAALTAMELTVFYVSALKTVLVPVLLVLAAAKFALVAMFYMHLRYDSWLLSGVLLFPLIIATVLLISLLFLFAYLAQHIG
ncbi:MAG TPA: cytochrome C oxidase subunit IV family protein [Candidatus Binataceae bacterium]|nr:cytochrome C oxidase subunit IV family protein [Candidatus Binataceae bacterium]